MRSRAKPIQVGDPAARAAIRRAQALNDDVDHTLDERDQQRALRSWRPLARAYPDDRAVMHGYVLALARVCFFQPTTAQRHEYLHAATRLAALDPRAPDAAFWRADALLAWGRVSGEPDVLEAAILESRRAGALRRGKSSRAQALAHEAQALRALGRREESDAKLAEADALDPRVAWWAKVEMGDETLG